jgi:hypothetical protein
MDLKKLATLTFAKNVGKWDRIFRLASGAGLVGVALYVGLPTWARAVMLVLGTMWTTTGVLSKCSIYYALGYSTCPLGDDRAP